MAVLVFAKSRNRLDEWYKIIESDEFRTMMQKTTSTLDVELRCAQALDSRKSSDDARVLEILAYVPHSSLNMEDCRRFKNHAFVKIWEETYGMNIIFQPVTLYYSHKKPGLAVFDMDSTLIQQEVIDELARKVGLYDQVAAITEAAMRGEAPYTDFGASLRARVKLLKGVPIDVWDDLKRDGISFTPGSLELVKALKRFGWKTAVLSGGFMPLAEWVKVTLGLDYAFANRLVEDPTAHVLTGDLVSGAPIVDGEKKRELLIQLADTNKIPLGCTIAVGDGSNDLPMMCTAGVGIAFNAKPKVQESAPTKLNSDTLLDVMHVLGYTMQEIISPYLNEFVNETL